MGVISHLVRAEFAARRLWSRVRISLRERATGFSEREAGDFLSQAEVFTAEDMVVDAEVHCDGCRCPTYCGCGREIYSERDRPGSFPLYWFHVDDGSPISAACTDSSVVSPPGAAVGPDPAAPRAGSGHPSFDF